MACKWPEDQGNDEFTEEHIDSETLWNSQGGVRETVAPEKHVVLGHMEPPKDGVSHRTPTQRVRNGTWR